MAASPETVSMAMFCDFENVALGVRDAKYDKFDIKPVLERLLLKGSIVLKKAYCDWERYKSFKATMHEANFELIEIPHVRQSGKNSADIRMVVDALDLCYTKSHVNTFVIVSGDSDFSPLVSKLRENAKYVIGVGVKQSTSDLLIANCDEFIFYDDLVREVQRSAARRDARSAPPAAKRSPEEERKRREEIEARKSEAIDLAVATFEALVAECGDSGKIWASMLKEAIKRRRPDFNETYFGFRAFGNLLEEAQARGLLELGRDEKSGAFVSRSSAAHAVPHQPGEANAVVVRDDDGEAAKTAAQEATIGADAASVVAGAGAAPVTGDSLPVAAESEQGEAVVPKRRSRGGKRQAAAKEARAERNEATVNEPVQKQEMPQEMPQDKKQDAAARGRSGRGGKPARPAAKRGVGGLGIAGDLEVAAPVAATETQVPVAVAEPVVAAAPVAAAAVEKKPATRSRRTRQPKVVADQG